MNKNVKIDLSPVHGLGVFALVDIPKGEVVFSSPLLVIPDNITENNILSEYVYSAADYEYMKYNSFMALGEGSLINHSADSNIEYDDDWNDDLRRYMIEYTAKRDIKAGEELFIDYGYDPTEEEDEDDEE